MSATTAVLDRKQVKRGQKPPTDPGQDVDLQRRLIYANGKFNDRVCSMIDALVKLRVDLQDLAGCQENGSIVNAWKKAGLPPLSPNDEEAHLILQGAEDIAFDATGFTWAITAYLSTLQNFVIRNRGRKG